MRAIWLACVCATGCELYFGPGDQDAATSPPPDAATVMPPDAATIAPPDPPATCSTTPVYVLSMPGDPRGPFVTASIKDALAFYHVPIVATTTPPSGGLTIALRPTGVGGVEIPAQMCSIQSGSSYPVSDDRSRSNEQIVADSLHGLGLLFTFPVVDNSGDCMAGVATPGCTFGRAETVQSDLCGLWGAGPIDEAQLLANGLGCPGVGH